MLTSSQILAPVLMEGDDADTNGNPAPSDEPTLGEPGAIQAAPPPHANAPPAAVSVFEGRLRARAKPSSSKTIAFDVPGEAKSKRQATSVSTFFLFCQQAAILILCREWRQHRLQLRFPSPADRGLVVLVLLKSG